MTPEGTPYMAKAGTTEWTTPKNLFDQLWEEVGGFDLDPACRPEHYTARRVLSAGGFIFVPPDHLTSLGPRVLSDGLKQDWFGKVYCNPPWGLALRKWVPYAIDQVNKGNASLIVMLVPATTDTQWWQQHVMTGVLYSHRWDGWGMRGQPKLGRWPDEVRFLPRRLTFGEATAPATKGTAILVWRR